ncbi:MAG TPA: sigma-70 family RNA polymerase sigma factor [Pyrinomonadaceae bacterium]|jgi:DNA-directed RNA polymerase specialized sigma24 family protein|nr:sigma-70 family RNA polymerase sigma factor [Pyrinomonadaceae bacterium]
MPSNDVITPEAFNTLLEWLDPDREEAGRKYEVIRGGLIKMFITRGCIEAENLADRTIDRVATKVKKIRDTFIGDPTGYFHGVARNIYLEHVKVRREDPAEIDPAAEVPFKFGSELECLRKCLSNLTAEQVILVLEYFLEESSAKILHRKTMAAELGVDPGTLRIRVHRLKAFLEDCVKKCLGVTN